jgi:hypothetical protein
LTALALGRPPAIRKLHILTGIETRSAAAAEGLFADGVGRHFIEVVATFLIT